MDSSTSEECIPITEEAIELKTVLPLPPPLVDEGDRRTQEATCRADSDLALTPALTSPIRRSSRSSKSERRSPQFDTLDFRAAGPRQNDACTSMTNREGIYLSTPRQTSRAVLPSSEIVNEEVLPKNTLSINLNRKSDKVKKCYFITIFSYCLHLIIILTAAYFYFRILPGLKSTQTCHCQNITKNIENMTQTITENITQTITENMTQTIINHVDNYTTFLNYLSENSIFIKEVLVNNITANYVFGDYIMGNNVKANDLFGDKLNRCNVGHC